MEPIRIIYAICVMTTIASVPALAAEPAADNATDLPAADRVVLDELLGKGIIGAPVAGNPIADPSAAFDFRDGTWTYCFVSGEKEGQTERVVFNVSKRDKTRLSGQYAVGSKDVDFLRRSSDGSIVVLDSRDKNEGVITRYSPPEPMLIRGFRPGDTKTMTIDVKVYDLGEPQEVSHTGSLNVVYSYLGAYRVTVPAGTYDAALLKWHYQGEVGPASVNDFQYRLFARDVGVVAAIDRLNVHAMLLYKDDAKSGRVLLSEK